MGAPPLRPAQPQELLAAAQLALLHVGAAREGAAAARDDRDLRLVLHVEPVQRVRERADQFVVEGVQLVRAIERQGDDLAVPLVVDERTCLALGHRSS